MTTSSASRSASTTRAGTTPPTSLERGERLVRARGERARSSSRCRRCARPASRWSRPMHASRSTRRTSRALGAHRARARRAGCSPASRRARRCDGREVFRTPRSLFGPRGELEAVVPQAAAVRLRGRARGYAPGDGPTIVDGRRRARQPLHLLRPALPGAVPRRRPRRRRDGRDRELAGGAPPALGRAAAAPARSRTSATWSA